MRILLQAPHRGVPKASRHPEVNQEHEPALEPDNQILATAIERCDALALQLGRDGGGVERTDEPAVMDLDPVEAAPDEHRLEPAAYRLDLGQLGHSVSLAAAGGGFG